MVGETAWGPRCVLAGAGAGLGRDREEDMGVLARSCVAW